MEELKREIAELKQEAAIEESKKKKKRGTREKVREDQVIDRHLANDAKKKLNSISCHDSQGMQDKFNTPGQNVGQSKGQPQKGPPAAKRNRPGEYRTDPAGTPQNNYSNLQGPQWGKSKGHQGPQSHSNSVTKKPTGLSNNSKIEFTARRTPPFVPNRPPNTQTTHPNPHTSSHNLTPPPGLDPSYPPARPWEPPHGVWMCCHQTVSA